ncbi:MAG: hypothetical protein Q8P93_02070 [bacterium]|nr:hypothetical protein [bacterium]
MMGFRPSFRKKGNGRSWSIGTGGPITSAKPETIRKKKEESKEEKTSDVSSSEIKSMRFLIDLIKKNLRIDEQIGIGTYPIQFQLKEVSHRKSFELFPALMYRVMGRLVHNDITIEEIAKHFRGKISREVIEKVQRAAKSGSPADLCGSLQRAIRKTR